MQNSYIVDVFLSATAWVVIAYLYFEVRAGVKAISEIMSASTLSVALGHVLKTASLIALPFFGFFGFLLWRFYALMVVSQSWGAGGMGLITGMAIIGASLIWVQFMLLLVRRSRFIDLSVKVNKINSLSGKGTA